MEESKKKEIINDWKFRKKEMGIIAIFCTETNDKFVLSVTDIYNIFNRHKFQLMSNSHTNSELQNLWNKYGEDKFEFTILKSIAIDENLSEKENKNILTEEYEKFLNNNDNVKKL